MTTNRIITNADGHASGHDRAIVTGPDAHCTATDYAQIRVTGEASALLTGHAGCEVDDGYVLATDYSTVDARLSDAPGAEVIIYAWGHATVYAGPGVDVIRRTLEATIIRVP